MSLTEPGVWIHTGYEGSNQIYMNLKGDLNGGQKVLGSNPIPGSRSRFLWFLQ